VGTTNEFQYALLDTMMIDKVTIEHFPNRYSRPAPIHPMSIERNGWSGGLALPQLG